MQKRILEQKNKIINLQEQKNNPRHSEILEKFKVFMLKRKKELDDFNKFFPHSELLKEDDYSVLEVLNASMIAKFTERNGLDIEEVICLLDKISPEELDVILL